MSDLSHVKYFGPECMSCRPVVLLISSSLDRIWIAYSAYPENVERPPIHGAVKLLDINALLT